jgi:hypothetical protein
MRYWAFSLACFLPLAALPACPPQLRAHLPFICAAAWIACAGLILLPCSRRFLRLALWAVLAYAFLGILRLPWRHEWDWISYWIGFGVFPLFAAGLHRFLKRLLGAGETAGRVYLALLAVQLFPVKVVFRLAGLGLPPTQVLSPMVLLVLVAGAWMGWRRLPETLRRALAG